VIQDAEFFIRCDPHMVKFEPSTPATAPVTPADITPTGAVKCYQVTDRVHFLPAGLWDSDAVSNYEFYPLANGVFVICRSPLSCLLESTWTIRENGDALELVEEVKITVSRMLVGTVKSQCDGNWGGIHKSIVQGMVQGTK
jgi:hypothetical protein